MDINNKSYINRRTLTTILLALAMTLVFGAFQLQQVQATENDGMPLDTTSGIATETTTDGDSDATDNNDDETNGTDNDSTPLDTASGIAVETTTDGDSDATDDTNNTNTNTNTDNDTNGTDGSNGSTDSDSDAVTDTDNTSGNSDATDGTDNNDNDANGTDGGNGSTDSDAKDETDTDGEAVSTTPVVVATTTSEPKSSVSTKSSATDLISNVISKTTSTASKTAASKAKKAAVKKNGIYKEGGKYYCYKNGVKLKNRWIYQGANRFYAGSNGSFLTNRFITYKGCRYYLGGGKGAVKYGIYKVGSNYYFGSYSTTARGKIRTYWFTEKNNRYAANGNGVLFRNRFVTANQGKEKYYVGNNGAPKTGTLKVGNYYYRAKVSGSKKGLIGTGWFKDGGKTYVANKNGVLTRNAWHVKSGNRYFTDGSGALVTGTRVIGGIPYKFRSNGTMVIQKYMGTYKGKKYYKDAKTGLPIRNRLLNVKGKLYYFGSDGKAISGWKKIRGTRFYFSPKTYASVSVKYAPFDSSYRYNGRKLTASAGTVSGPSGKETYYNLYMGGVVSIMRSQGFSASRFPYWVRSDGCKMLGNYVIVAAHLGSRPRGSIVETSRGLGLVCDTGGFAFSNRYQLDLATNW